MPQTYFPLAGTHGLLVISGIALHLDHYDINMHCNIIRCPSFPSAPYVPHAAGLKEMGGTASGVWNASVNPNSSGIKIGTVHTMRFVVDQVEAADDDAWIADFNTTVDVDGEIRYTIVFVGEWEFTDFSAALA